MSGEVEKAQQAVSAPPAALGTAAATNDPESVSPEPLNSAEKATAQVPANGAPTSGPESGADEVHPEPAPPGKADDEAAVPATSPTVPSAAKELPGAAELPAAAPVHARPPLPTDAVPKLPAVLPDKITRADAERAEDAAVRMLAANLAAPTPTETSKDVEMKDTSTEPESQSVEESPVTGEKRKAAGPAEANGDESKKKSSVGTAIDNLRAKVGRPKKDKKTPPVGQTARRTRSQGGLDA